MREEEGRRNVTWKRGAMRMQGMRARGGEEHVEGMQLQARDECGGVERVN